MVIYATIIVLFGFNLRLLILNSTMKAQPEYTINETFVKLLNVFNKRIFKKGFSLIFKGLD